MRRLSKRKRADAAPSADRPTIVVGIGAAEGAFRPLRALLSGLSKGQGLALIVAQHVPEGSDGLLASLTPEQTPLEIRPETPVFNRSSA